MRLFYSKRRFLKKFLRACITLFMSVSIVCCSVVAPVVSTPVRTEAAAEVVAKIGAYILSTLGVVNMTTNGGVTSASNSIKDQINQKVSDYLGTGVYEDSNGNYVFSNAFSSEIYNILSSTFGTSARVISNFGSESPVLNSAYMSPEFLSTIQSQQNSYDYYTTVIYQYGTGANSYIRTYAITYNTENVGYINVGDYNTLKYTFKGKNLNAINIPYKGCQCLYEKSTGNFAFFDGGTGEVSESPCYLTQFYPSLHDFTADSFFQGLPHFIIKRSSSYPVFKYPNNGATGERSVETDLKVSMRSNRSLVIAKDGTSANSLLNQTTGIFYNTSDYAFPSVSKTVIENNNWSSIYNNYVTNVSNNYNTSSDKSIDKLRQIMKNYGDNILDAIEEGSTNIEEQISYTNEWLNKIYIKLDNIFSVLQEVNNKDFNVVVSGGGASTGGGGSCNWSQTEIDTLLSDLNNIYTKLLYSETYLYHIDNVVSGNATTLDNIYTNNVSQLSYLQNLYTLLSNVYTAILNIDSGGGGGGGGVVPLPDSDPYADWFEVLHNIPQVDLDDMFDKFDVLKAVLQNTAPFVMLGIITVTLNSFKAEPVAPEFSIPVKLQNDIIDIDESIELDLTVMDTMIPLLRDLILILWTIGLLMFAWWLIPKIYIIIN